MRYVLLLVLLHGMTACSTMGLALAEDVTRIAGQLTNQQQTAGQLGDQIAQLRAAREAREKELAAGVSGAAVQADQARAQLETLKRQLSDELGSTTATTAAGGVGLLLLNMLLVYLQGNARNKSRGTLIESIMGAVIKEVRGGSGTSNPKK